MPHTPRTAEIGTEPYQNIYPDVIELCRVHDVSLDLIERSHDLDELLDGILDEYERRLADLPADAFDHPGGPASPVAAGKLRALMMFARQAAALKEKAAASAELAHRARALEEANGRLEAALAETDSARRRLSAVLATLDAGIVILAGDGAVEQSNRAVRVLIGTEDREPGGDDLRSLLDGVPRGGDGEVVRPAAGEGSRVFMVARRDLEPDRGTEVVLLSDITARMQRIEERHRLEKLAESLRTMSALSHKINNPLTALLGRAQILKAQENLDPRVAKASTVIEESAMRIAELVRELARTVKEGRQEALDQVLDLGTTRAPYEAGDDHA